MKRIVGPLLLACVVGHALADGRQDVPALVKQLKDKDDIVRLKAAKALGKLGADARDAIPALTDATKDPDEDVRVVAKQALKKVKEAVAEVDKDEALKLLSRHLASLKGDDQEARGRAVKGLAELLKNDDDIIRAKAAKGLGEAGDAARGALKALNDAAKDPDDVVRREARRAIARIEDAATAERREQARAKLGPLLKKLKDRSPTVRQKAIEEIAEVGPDGVEASEELVKALNDRAPAIQQSALEALEKVNPSLHKPVTTLLVDRDANAKLDAMRKLGKLGPDGRPAIPLLVRFYHAQRAPGAGRFGHYYSVGILEALNEIDQENKEYISLLLSALPLSNTSYYPSRRDFILDSRERAKAISLAERLVKDKKLDAARLVRPLLGALNDRACRIQAIQALGGLGVEGKDAIPTLKKLKVDPDMATREAAAEALKKIE
jgi:HEAT repeat protein